MVECDSLVEGTFGGTSFLGRVIRTEEVAGEDLLGAWEPALVSPGRAFLRTLSACSRLLSWAGLSTTAETLLAEVFTTTWPLPVGTVTTVGALLVGAVTTVVEGTLLVEVFTRGETLPLGAVTTVGTLLA